METHQSVEGHFKHSHVEITWTREDSPTGASLDTVTRTYGHGIDYSETLTFEDPEAAGRKFFNWTMTIACITDEQQLENLYLSLKKEKELEQVELWKKAVLASQVAQAAHLAYHDATYDPQRSPSERNQARQGYMEAQRSLVAVLVELKLVKRP